jgi:hypothetical protein
VGSEGSVPADGNGTTEGIAAVGEVAIGEGIIPGVGEIIGVGVRSGEVESVGEGVITGDGDGGTDDVGIVRVQAVKAIVPIPINNLKYLTLDLN